MKLSQLERSVIALTQGGLPASRDPFGHIARSLGISRGRVIKVMKGFREGGVLRRVSAILDQRKLGVMGNVMVAWRVPADRLDRVGEVFADFDEVTHCYARRSYPDWPYNLYTMLHAQTEDACRRLIDEMARRANVQDRRELYTVRELSKKSASYYDSEEALLALPFPVSLLLSNRLCVVVGGGDVGRRKAGSLLVSGARVRVVAPVINDDMEAFEGVELIRESYRASHLEGARLVIAATDSPELNHRIASDAEAVGALVNVVDDPAASDFIVPACVRRGDLQIAVQTRGASPALAATLRRRIERTLPERIEDLVSMLARLRDEILDDVDDPGQRRRVLSFLGSEEALELFERRGVAALEDRARTLLLSSEGDAR